MKTRQKVTSTRKNVNREHSGDLKKESSVLVSVAAVLDLSYSQCCAADEAALGECERGCWEGLKSEVRWEPSAEQSNVD